MEGGTEAFPDLGKHCQLADCNQLDFLPFKCDGCRKVFCVEHRSYKSHDCSNSDHNSRKVLVCETCSISIEIPRNSKGGEDEMNSILTKHQKSGDCDPKKKKKKPTCGVKRCKEILTFSNTSSCRSCQIKFCLKHRFQSDHACKSNHQPTSAAANTGGVVRPFLVALAARNGGDCTKKSNNAAVSGSKASTSVKAY